MVDKKISELAAAASAADANELAINEAGTSKKLTVGQVKTNVLAAHAGTDHTGIPGVGGGGLAIYGDGHHGSVDLDGVNTFDFADLSGSTYTLNRTLYAEDITIGPGVTLNANCWPIYGRGTLTYEGTIHTDGGTEVTPQYAALVAGGQGGSGAGTQGGTGQPGHGFYSANELGTGGVGGAVPNFAGGPAGDPDPWWNLQRSALGGGSVITNTFVFEMSQVLIRAPYAGGSGGGGGASQAGGIGGNAGRGGSPVLISVRHIVNSGGTIRSLGQDGADGTIGATYPDWVTLQGYFSSDRIQPSAHVYEAEADGTSGAVEPTWTDDGNPVTDNDITWLDKGVPGAAGGAPGQGGNLIFLYDTFTGALPVAAVDCAPGTPGVGIGSGSDGTAGDPGHVITIANA